MTVTEYKTCPVCDGSKTRTITKYEGLRSTSVKIPCTACEGKGKILFINLTKPKLEEKPVKVLNVSGLSDGWRSNQGWSNIARAQAVTTIIKLISPVIMSGTPSQTHFLRTTLNVLSHA